MTTRGTIPDFHGFQIGLPEPSTWAMFALGLSLLAYAVRRRQAAARKAEVVAGQS